MKQLRSEWIPSVFLCDLRFERGSISALCSRGGKVRAEALF
jgi:hypothetical protein